MNQKPNTDIHKLIRRSSLIFPVNVSRFVQKAYSREADCYVMDLEDSVPNEEKKNARALIKDSIPVVGKGGGDVSVRINRPLELAKKDLEASIWPGLTCVSIPKVESAAEVRVRDNIITELETKRGLPRGGIQIAVAVETPIGILKAFEIANSSSRIVTINVGAEDLTREMGISITEKGDELWYSRSKVLLEACAAGIQPLGIIGVDPFSWRALEKILDAAKYSRKLGFKGCNSIHPAPIPHLNKGFSLPEDEIDYASRALKAFKEGTSKKRASVNVDGRMVDIATAERCKKILERAKAIETMEKRKEKALKNPIALEEKLRNAIKRLEKNN